MSPSKDGNGGFRAWTITLLTAIILLLGGFWSVSSVKAWGHDVKIKEQDKVLEEISKKLDKLLDRQYERGRGR